jgi:hypothetical protein
MVFAVYIYVDASDDNENFPEEVRSKYIITRELGAGACGKVYLVFEKVSTQTRCEVSSTGLRILNGAVSDFTELKLSIYRSS